MKDLEILLENKVGELARFGETLGEHKISLEGGGVFAIGEQAIAHFLVEDADRAKKALQDAGFRDVTINDVVIQKLRQDVPGQLGMFCRRLADRGVNINTQYSDHANQLIVVVDDREKAAKVGDDWMKEWW
ncbi:MAG: amino acid-binding ACT domain-containing protein [Pyrinomonadaceae bacterium]